MFLLILTKMLSIEWLNPDTPDKDSSLEWQGRRASGEWFQPIIQSISTLHDEESLKWFLTVGALGDQIPVDEPWLLEEKKRLETFCYLLVELASARAWSQMMFTNNVPHALVGIMHPSEQVAAQLHSHHQKIWSAVLKAEQMMVDTTVSKEARKLLKSLLMNDLCWQQLQIAREIYITCERAGWVANHPSVITLVNRLFGAPFNTKYDLEDLFAHLVSVAKLSSQATPMGKPPALASGKYFRFFFGRGWLLPGLYLTLQQYRNINMSKTDSNILNYNWIILLLFWKPFKLNYNPRLTNCIKITRWSLHCPGLSRTIMVDWHGGHMAFQITIIHWKWLFKLNFQLLIHHKL